MYNLHDRLEKLIKSAFNFKHAEKHFSGIGFMDLQITNVLCNIYFMFQIIYVIIYWNNEG